VDAFRARALGSGLAAGALAIAGLAVVNSDAPALYDGLTSGAGLACVIGSAAAGLVTLALEWRERFEIARYTAAAAVAAIVAGWAVAQEPYILPPELTVREAAAPDATLTALLIAATVGMALLLPALAWLFKLALSGRLAYEEEPRP
jgi:cytochrome d ubiquinol oxidase subunit II